MPRGKTSSPYGRAARKEKAFDYYSRGFSIIEVARELQVDRTTASRYKQLYENSLQSEATNNPTLLRDILRNTVRALTELDQVRAEAWKRYEATENEATKATFLNTALKALEQRAKLFQLFGVKAEYMAQVALIQRQQDELVRFLGEHEFCEPDRDAIVDFLARQISTNDLDSLAVTSAGDTR